MAVTDVEQRLRAALDAAAPDGLDPSGLAGRAKAAGEPHPAPGGGRGGCDSRRGGGHRPRRVLGRAGPRGDAARGDTEQCPGRPGLAVRPGRRPLPRDSSSRSATTGSSPCCARPTRAPRAGPGSRGHRWCSRGTRSTSSSPTSADLRSNGAPRPVQFADFRVVMLHPDGSLEQVSDDGRCDGRYVVQSFYTAYAEQRLGRPDATSEAVAQRCDPLAGWTDTVVPSRVPDPASVRDVVACIHGAWAPLEVDGRAAVPPGDRPRRCPPTRWPRCSRASTGPTPPSARSTTARGAAPPSPCGSTPTTAWRRTSCSSATRSSGPIGDGALAGPRARVPRRVVRRGRSPRAQR